MNPGSDPHTMLKIDPEPSEVELHLTEIMGMDCNPQVYHCALYAKSYRDGYDCVVTFRTNDSGISDLTTGGKTPEEALCKAIDLLDTKFGRCPTCGQYRKG